MRIPDKVLKTINTAYTHIAQTRMGTAFVTGWGMAMELDLRRTLVLYFAVQIPTGRISAFRCYP